MYNIETDELFFLQYPFHGYREMTDEHETALCNRFRFMRDLDPFDAPGVLAVIDRRWLEAVPNPIFSLRLAGFYYRVLVEMAHALAWKVYQDRNRGIRLIRYIESKTFLYRDIKKNGSEDVANWTVHDTNYTFVDFIQIENEKGNMTNIFAVADQSIPIHQIVNADTHAALKMIALRFPENEISDNHEY